MSVLLFTSSLFFAFLLALSRLTSLFNLIITEAAVFLGNFHEEKKDFPFLFRNALFKPLTSGDI